MTRPLQQGDAGPSDLRSPEAIRTLFSRFAATPPAGYEQWQHDLANFLQWVGNATVEMRSTTEFHERLWNDNKVSSAGRGSIPVDAVINDAAFREWLARTSVASLPSDPNEVVSYLAGIYKEMQERVRPHCDRMPYLKMFRILAALFPKRFTTVCDRYMLRQLHRTMFGDTGGAGSVARHSNVLRRFEEVLGPSAEGLPPLVQRMTFAWYLAQFATSPEEPPVKIGPPGAEKLTPLPAIRRRKGLTSTRGYIASVMNILEFARDGVTRVELLEYLRSQNPNARETTLATVINMLLAELNVIRREGDRYVLTSTGESLLESDDPLVLAPWLITRILGVDHALVSLRDKGEQSRDEMVPSIQAANPNWKTDWTPHSILNWLKAIGLIDITTGQVSLTDAGKEWAPRIDWVPENLPREDETAPIETGPVPEPSQVSVPTFSTVYQAVSAKGQFDRSLVATLHAGMWAHTRRHFAIFTGLSGAGKTMLAMEYARAISGDQANRTCIVTVQPGWSDATALLGYVNPLRHDTYVRTPFLEFLIVAASDPTNPYIAILDEMNLSHPEQYLAPLLSAMETGAFVELHQEDDVFDGVPSRTIYPNNLVLIGTVNMDETTHGLSDKVLDRALTLEFWNIDIDAYPRWGKRTIPADVENSARAVLKELIEVLAPARLHFGWRVIDDVLDFLSRASGDGFDLNPQAALDAIVYAKVIPKLRGDDSQRFHDALEGCRKILQEHGLPKSKSRVNDLLDDLGMTGTARFWR